jgi:hypothetical protein
VSDRCPSHACAASAAACSDVIQAVAECNACTTVGFPIMCDGCNDGFTLADAEGGSKTCGGFCCRKLTTNRIAVGFVRKLR